MAHPQTGPKRQKVRENRVADYIDYFQAIEKVEFNSMCSVNDCTAYKYYNNTERIQGRSMEDWMRVSLSYTEFRFDGNDRSRPNYQRSWDDSTNTMENYKRGIKTFFDLCSKLGVKYFTAFDTDLVPVSDNWDETKLYWDEMIEFIQDNMNRTHVKPLWIAPDLHSCTKYTSGALTSSDINTFTHAASQIKKYLEISQKLNSECFLLWPCREGYEAIFKTDVARELKTFAKLLKMAADYKERLNLRCLMLIQPFDGSVCFNGPKRSLERDCQVNRYMWDVTSCLYFLKHYNLDRHYKVCSPPGHQTFMANVYNMLGGVFLSNEYQNNDNRELTLLMQTILKQGSCPTGGLNLRLSPRSDISDSKDLIAKYVRTIDGLARGLRVASLLATEQILSKQIQQKYSSYLSGFGAKVYSADITLEDCEEYNRKNPHLTHESHCEYLDVVFQRYLDSSDQV